MSRCTKKNCPMVGVSADCNLKDCPYRTEADQNKDTIYREDAIKAINARTNWYQVTCNGKQIAVMLMAKDVNETLEKVPSAYRPQGEWEEKTKFHNADDDSIIEEWQSAKCSVCGKHHTTPYLYYFNDYNFCPNCGAKMKGADDE